MDAAKAAVAKFTSNRGHHTTVEETVNPHVINEVIKPHRHEEQTQAVDREVHQHHYHTTVQPLEHKERLPEKHTHNIVPTEHREYRHDNEQDTKAKVAAELGRFKDHSVTHETHHTQAAAASVTGEHVHHHVHETVVPVVHKETIQPEVVHTTVPVHETHHAAAQHHGLSALPMKSLDEFKKGGGILTGGNHGTHEEYEGQPRKYNDKMSTTFAKLGLGGSTTDVDGKTHHRQTDSGVGGVGHHDTLGSSTGSSGIGHHSGTNNTSEYSNRSGNGIGGTGIGGTGSSGRGIGSELGHDSSRGSALPGSTRENASDIARKDLGYEGNRGSSGLSNSTSTGSSGQYAESGDLSRKTKPSLMDRLNPSKDTTGDGKPGFMS